MTVRLSSPYTPISFFEELEKYSDCNESLEIIFPDDCTDAFSTFFNLNALNNVRAIELPWNFGAAPMAPFCPPEPSTSVRTSTSEPSSLPQNFPQIYYENMKLLELSAIQILENKEDIIIQNLKYANNLMKASLSIPLNKSIRQICFRTPPLQEKAVFCSENEHIYSFDRKFLYI